MAHINTLNLNTHVLDMYLLYIKHNIFSPFYALSFNTTLIFIDYLVIIQLFITVTIIAC